MRKYLILLAFLISLSSAHAVSPIAEPSSTPPAKASEITFQLGPDKKTISLEDLAHMSAKEFSAISHRHLNLIERAEFALAQRKLRNSINPDGTINSKRLAKMLPRIQDGDTGFHIGGFALGFLLGLIGILIAYLINDDYKHNRVKWAWIGFGSFLVIYILLLVALA